MNELKSISAKDDQSRIKELETNITEFINSRMSQFDNYFKISISTDFYKIRDTARIFIKDKKGNMFLRLDINSRVPLEFNPTEFENAVFSVTFLEHYKGLLCGTDSSLLLINLVSFLIKKDITARIFSIISNSNLKWAFNYDTIKNNLTFEVADRVIQKIKEVTSSNIESLDLIELKIGSDYSRIEAKGTTILGDAFFIHIHLEQGKYYYKVLINENSKCLKSTIYKALDLSRLDKIVFEVINSSKKDLNLV